VSGSWQLPSVVYLEDVACRNLCQSSQFSANTDGGSVKNARPCACASLKLMPVGVNDPSGPTENNSSPISDVSFLVRTPKSFGPRKQMEFSVTSWSHKHLWWLVGVQM